KTGASKSFQTLSGGEKRKVRIACSLALQDLVASRVSKHIELFIGDEIDAALDTAALERLMGTLEAKARARGTVMIISHNATKS
ncbi:exonuclease, partial [Enterobacter hormaechei]|nr:exonuclease [Enterobacter hormaechei]